MAVTTVKETKKANNSSSARAELARRALARRKLIAFSEYLLSWYGAAPHHKMIAEKLEQVERYIATKGKEGIGRLVIQVHPRSGKTEIVSKIFPSWLLGRQPDSRVILTSYGADLATENSRSVRNYLQLERYQNVFGARSSVDDSVSLSDDSRSASSWSLAEPHRGGVVAAGVGGGITGKGAHLLILDDPFKNREEAESEDHRARVISWWNSSAYTRLEDGAAIVIIHTRWHPDDVIGHLLQKMASDDPLADQYDVLFLPAIALEEDEYAPNEEEFQKNLLEGLYLPTMEMGDALGRKAGEALWPEKYPREALDKIAANIEDYEFSSLYQQLPRLLSGGFFDQKSFKIIDHAPEGLVWMGYLDIALGESERADWNACGRIAFDTDANLYIRDMVRVHEYDRFVSVMVDVMLSPEERNVVWGVEANAFQKLAFREFMKNRRLVNVPIYPITVDKDKVTRARPLRSRCVAGKVYLVRGAWTRTFLSEAIGFPQRKHDDQVDTISGGIKMWPMYGKGEQRKMRQRSWA
jgi:predicted phage terminase large subunit-like protein